MFLERDQWSFYSTRTVYYSATKVDRYQLEVNKMFDFSAKGTSRSETRLSIGYLSLHCAMLSHAEEKIAIQCKH